MSEYGLLLENPTRRRRNRQRTPPRGAAGRFRKRRSTRRSRRRNPSAVTVANPRRRRRRRSVARRRSPRRRRRNPRRLGILPGRGEMQRAFRKGGELLVGEFVGDVLARVATKFGVGRLLTQMRVPAEMTVPATRIAVGLLGPAVLRFAPRMFKPSFREMFAAVNVASGLIGLTMNMRTQAFSAMGLADYEDLGLYDWETAENGVGDWETADDGVGDYELADAPPAGILGEAPPAGILEDYHETGVMSY